MDQKENQKLFDQRWEVLTERIAYLERMVSKYLVKDAFANYEGKAVWNKIYILVDFYEEILVNYNEKVKLINDKTNIVNFKNDYRHIKSIKYQDYDSKALKALLLSLSEINFNLKNVIKDVNTDVLIKSKEPINDKIDYDVVVEINANKSTVYMGKLYLKLIMSTAIKKIANLKQAITAFKFDYQNNWYADTSSGQLFFGKDDQVKKEFNLKSFSIFNFITSITLDEKIIDMLVTRVVSYITVKHNKNRKRLLKLDSYQNAITIDNNNNNNWYAGDDEGALYSGRSGEPGRRVLGLSKNGYFTNYAFNMQDNSWYASSNSGGELYYGKLGQQASHFTTLFPKVNEVLLQLKIDNVGHWYAMTNKGKLYYGRSKQDGTLIANLSSHLKGYNQNSITLAIDNNKWYVCTTEGEIFSTL